jgi:hypothetical protein
MGMRTPIALLATLCVGSGLRAEATHAAASEPPAYFAEPKTQEEMREVVRILESYPPSADIEYHDWTDAWTPYLMPHRLERLAELLVKLGRPSEARDRLWRIYERTPVMYKGRAFHYGRPSEEGLLMLFSEPLWNEGDVARRLKQTRRYFIDEQVTALYAYRRTLGSGNFEQALDRIVKAQSNWPWNLEMIEQAFRTGKLGLMMRLLVQSPGAYPAVLARYRHKLPTDRYGHEVLPLVFLLGELGKRDALVDLLEGLFHPVANDRFVRELLCRVVGRMAPATALAKLGEIHDAERPDHLRPFDTEGFQAIRMGTGSIRESLAVVDENGLRLLPDPMQWQHRIVIRNPGAVDSRRRGKLIVRFRVEAERAHSDQPLDYTDVEIVLTRSLWLDDLR